MFKLSWFLGIFWGPPGPFWPALVFVLKNPPTRTRTESSESLLASVAQRPWPLSKPSPHAKGVCLDHFLRENHTWIPSC